MTEEEAADQERLGLFTGECSGCHIVGHRFARCPDQSAILERVHREYAAAFAAACVPRILIPSRGTP